MDENHSSGCVDYFNNNENERHDRPRQESDENSDSGSKSGFIDKLGKCENDILLEDNLVHDNKCNESVYNNEKDLPNNIGNELEMLKVENKLLQEEILELRKDNAGIEAERLAELHAVQLEGLENTLLQQKEEIEHLRECLRQQEDLSQKHLNQVKQEYDSKIDQMNKKYETANKEKESMVMKYAMSEKSAIDLRKEVLLLENKIKDLNKEKEAFQIKIKALATDKSKISLQLDSKVSEIAKMERESQKKKDEIQMRDSKIKWAQNRLKSEIESHIETQNKLEKLQKKFNEIKEETEQFKKHTQAIIKNFQISQEDKIYEEEKTKVIIEQNDEETLVKLQQEVENYKQKQKNVMEENNYLNLKIQSLEKERLEFESKISGMEATVNLEKSNAVDLSSKLVDFESMQILLEKEQERLTVCQCELEKLRTLNTDLQLEIESCRGKEAELLQFTQKLTEKNVLLQSELSAVSAKSHQLQIEHDNCERDIGKLKETVVSLTNELGKEKIQREKEKETQAKYMADQNEKINNLSQALRDQEGENQLLKKKHLVSLKELTKELSACRKRLEIYENSNCNISLGEGSRTSSTASLNAMETSDSKSSSNHLATANSISFELDPQILINKIIEIQRLNVRKTEKLEFLEEHVKQLVLELQKKSRIIQSYIIREQTGSLSSDTMDNYKASLVKHGGIMASVYNSKAVDDGMTLEFSLEINRKLQAVLEDTLLKNITLKENIETLGNEIAKLTSCVGSKEGS